MSASVQHQQRTYDIVFTRSNDRSGLFSMHFLSALLLAAEEQGLTDTVENFYSNLCTRIEDRPGSTLPLERYASDYIEVKDKVNQLGRFRLQVLQGEVFFNQRQQNSTRFKQWLITSTTSDFYYRACLRLHFPTAIQYVHVNLHIRVQYTC